MRHNRHTLFSVGLIVIVVLAAIPRLHSYDFSLPYIDHADEPNKYLGAQEWRGLYDSRGYYDGYPPGYVVIQLTTQIALESLGAPGMPPAVQLLRLVSIAADLLTIVYIALTVKLCAGAVAALLASLVWATAPLVIENNVYALPDPIIALLGVLTIWLVAHALLTPNREHWAVWSVIAGLLATLMKYSALPLIGPGILAAMLLSVRQRRFLRLLTWQAAIVIGVLIWLFFVYGIDVSSIEREGATIRESGFSNILQPDRVVSNLQATLTPVSVPVFLLMILLGLCAYVIAQRDHLPTINAPMALICIAVVVLIPWFVAAYTVVLPYYRIRDILPATTAACVLLGLAFQQLLFTVRSSARGAVASVLVILMTIVVFIPNMQAVAQLVGDREPPDRRVALRQWADTSLEPGTVIVTPENHKTFNPFWSGLVGRKWFDWWISENFLEYSLDEWRDERGMTYVVFSEAELNELRATEHGDVVLAQLLHLRDFDETPGRGPKMSVYRLWRMDEEINVCFGDAIRLIGVDRGVHNTDNGAFAFRFYWQASHTPAANYSLFLHLITPDSPVPLAQVDGAPASLDRPTMTWDTPGETIIGQRFLLDLPTDRSANYHVIAGLYDYSTGVRLPVSDCAGSPTDDVYTVHTTG